MCTGVLLLPSLLMLLEAVCAGTRRNGGAGVEVGVLVQRHGVRGVPVAEDVATASTVMATNEIVEAALARRVIADRGFRIRLFELCETKGFQGRGESKSCLPSSACGWGGR